VTTATPPRSERTGIAFRTEASFAEAGSYQGWSLKGPATYKRSNEASKQEHRQRSPATDAAPVKLLANFGGHIVGSLTVESGRSFHACSRSQKGALPSRSYNHREKGSTLQLALTRRPDEPTDGRLRAGPLFRCLQRRRECSASSASWALCSEAPRRHRVFGADRTWVLARILAFFPAPASSPILASFLTALSSQAAHLTIVASFLGEYSWHPQSLGRLTPSTRTIPITIPPILTCHIPSVQWGRLPAYNAGESSVCRHGLPWSQPFVHPKLPNLGR
jgi:hypothetical protein